MKNVRYDNSDTTLIMRIWEHLMFAILLIVTLILLLFVGDRRAVFSGGHLAIYQQMLSSFSNIVNDKLDSARKLRHLRAEHEALLQRIDVQEIIRTDPISNWNQLQALRQVIRFQEELEFASIVAEIIGKDPNQIYNSFIINKGSDSAIGIDMVVVAIQQGRVGLVGKIHRVSKRSAIVQTILDPQSFIATKVENSQLNGITRGISAPSAPPLEQIISMRFIDARDTDNVGFGSRVVTSGFSSLYYPEIPVGTVTQLQGNNYEQILQVDIEPVINFNTLQYVFVLIPRSF